MSFEDPGDASRKMPELVKKALKKIQQLSEENARLKQNSTAHEPIAIIGVACRFPGDISSLDDLWELLHAKKDIISYQLRENYTHSKQPRAGGFLKSPYDFARDFFKISQREAKTLDPQQRLLLELTWEALENAAICPSVLTGSNTGIFVGIGTDDYSQLLVRENIVGSYFASGNSHSTAAGRLSHVFDLQGPCLSIDTACSSSLVALHLACDSIQKKECNMAIVGAVSMLLNDLYHENFEQAGMLAKDGLCKVFDDRADGYVRSEGCGVVVLKTLSQAKADGDEIWAVIEGSAINHDGRSSGLTVPNRIAQEQVIEKALSNAQKSFEQIAFIETHGTGTALGDPIEINAIISLCHKYDRQTPLYLSAVKANLGHLEPAAGMAGLFKAMLCLKHQTIPAQIHFDTPNHRVDWQSAPIIVPKTTILASQNFAYAGVSSFGFSGTNAHIILAAHEKSVTDKNEDVSSVAQILTLSARTTHELQLQVEQYKIFIAEQNDNALSDICFTASSGREKFSETVFFIAGSKAAICQLLQSFDANVFQKYYVDPACMTDANVKNILTNQLKVTDYYKENKYKKVCLPTYPFVREYIHFDQSFPQNPPGKTPDDYLYKIDWSPVTLSTAIVQETYDWVMLSLHSACNSEAIDLFKCDHLVSLNDLEKHLSYSNNERPVGIIFYFAINENIKTDFLELDVVEQLVNAVRLCVKINKKIKFWLLVTGRQSDAASAALTGAFSALKLEFPAILQGNIRCEYESLLMASLPQALFTSAQYKQLVLTNEGAKVPVLTRAEIASAKRIDYLFSTDDVYVITGGSGGIAQILLPWLQQQGVSKIALLSRHPPSWFLPGGVRHFAVDVTDENALTASFAQITAQMGIIKGIFHAAGQNFYQPTHLLTREFIADIMAPKIIGAKVIARYCAEHPLDFVMHFGSVAGVWGVAKMVPYCAADECLEAIANSHANHFLIHWGAWHQIGMAKRAIIENNGIQSLSLEQAYQALNLSLSTRQILTAVQVNWVQFIKLYNSFWQNHLFDHFNVQQEQSIETNLPTHILTKELIQSVLAKLLDAAAVDIREGVPFQEMGADSIIAVEFSHQLQHYVKKPLPATLLFDYPTLEKLTAHLLQQASDGVSLPKNNIPRSEPIAIIGVSCRVGDCENANTFWQKLLAGESLVHSDINEELFARTGERVPSAYISAGQLLENSTYFDCNAFNISPREARLMDPQQRLLLECAWETIDSAGYSIEQVKDQAGGVFIGASNNDYAAICRKYMDKQDDLLFPASQALNMIAGRVAYFFGLNGPGMVVDTACSSSLMAVHLACQSLLSGESSFALAGGVNLIFNLENTKSLANANMLSKSGACRPFDQSADGYVRGEGVGLVMLKPLSLAKQDGDSILGIIHGSAANQDGKSASLTAPSTQAQIAVMQQALARSEFNSEAVDFVEAHGTGTTLGDLIEWQSIQKVFTLPEERSKPLFISSIKGQVGHAESAAGILSLISALARIRSGRLLAQGGLTALNNHINAKDSNFIIPTTSVDKSQQNERIGVINAFGFSGTNVSLVLANEPMQAVENINQPFPVSKKQFNRQNYTIVPEFNVRQENAYKQINASLYGLVNKPQSIVNHPVKSVFKANALDDLINKTIPLPEYDNFVNALNCFCVAAFTEVINTCQSITPLHNRYVDLMSFHVKQAEESKRILADEEKPAIAAEYQLIKQVAKHLKTILEGKEPALNVLFPNGSSELVNGVYQHSIKSRQMNQSLVETLKNLLTKRHDITKPLRILEVGAGTGGTTRSILQLLDKNSYHYTYTDISASLLENARQHFNNFENITYHRFDLEHPEELSFTFYQKFDVVIAANVIHATKNIPQTLALLNQCLAMQGVLLIFEGTQKIPWIDFIFGLTPGWWAFADERLNHPLLTPDEWRLKLQQNHFTVTVMQPDEVCGQIIIAAQKQHLTENLPKPALLAFVATDEERTEWLTAAAKTGLNMEVVLPGNINFNDKEAFDKIFNQCNRPFSRYIAVHYQWSEEPFTFVRLLQAKNRSLLRLTPLSIMGTDNSEGAMLFSMAQVAALEYPDCAFIKILANEHSPYYVIDELYTEKNLSHIYYQEGKRYGRYLMSIEQRENPNVAPVIQGTAWIITGGCGGLGLEMAHFLAQNGARALILLGRHGIKKEHNARVQALKTNYKIEMIIQVCDVADNNALEKIAMECKRLSYPIKGILHLAGIVRDRLIDHISLEEYQAVFQAKVYGTQALIRLAKMLTVDYFIAFSTATAILGNRGQINHAAANAYMDSYLLAHRTQFKRVITINWGPWSQTGAVDPALITQMQAKGIQPFTITLGLNIFASILATENIEQVMAITIDWSIFSNSRTYQSFYHNFWKDNRNNNTTVLSEDKIDDNIKQQIKTIFSQKLQYALSRFDDITGFSMYGVDSLMAIALVTELSQHFGQKFESTLLFDYPTFDSLAIFIAGKINKRSIKNALMDLIATTQDDLL